MQAVAHEMERTSENTGGGRHPLTSWFTVLLVGAMALVMVIEIAVTRQGLQWMVDTFGLHAAATDWGSPSFLLTLISNQFIHADASHFFFNTLLLLLVGATLEWRIGWRNTLAIWLFGSIFSNIAHIVFLPEAEGALGGASGGISALLGAAFVICAGTGIPIRLSRRRRPFFTLTVSMAIGAWLTLQVASFVQFLIVSQVPWVAYWAHLAGFAFGALAAATLITMSGGRLTDRSFGAAETASAGD